MGINLPLAGVRVLDLSTLLPGPYCSRILADFGADVIKIERPGGGDWSRYAPPIRDGRGALFDALNHGKKSLTLNLKSDAGKEIFRRLAERSDVILETFRPGVMERLGLGYPALARANPGLLYCALSGYGAEGAYRERAGHDLNYIGLAGLLALTGHAGRAPSIPGAPIADLTGGLWASIGILLLLFARSRGAGGGRVEASLLGAALACLPMAVASQAGGAPLQRGASELTGGFVCYNVYECEDGRFLTLAALEPDFWAAFCAAIGRPDLASEQFSSASPGEGAYEDLCRLFKTRPRDTWVRQLQAADCCCEPVLSVGEAELHEAVRALEMFADGALRPPLVLGEARPSVREVATAGRPRAAELGEHTAPVLGELGYDAAQIEALRQEGVV
jgi:crotonobetainyl-CoA:carnitine CoA-transferase CaiB-like acyl-CoA transferase